MAGSAFVLVIVVFNCMLCAKCDLKNSNEGVTEIFVKNVEHSLIIGNVSTHKQLGQISPQVYIKDKSIIDDYALLQTIVQNTGSNAKVSRCIHYVIAGIETKPTCTPVVFPINATTVTSMGSGSTAVEHHTHKNLRFPSNFKRYDLTRLSEGCFDDAHKFITKIYLPWQVVQIFSDRAFDEADIEAMHDALYESAYIVTKIFNVSRSTFLNFIGKIPATQTIFVLDSQKLFHAAAGKPANRCWLYGHHDFYINKDAKCGSHLQLLSVLYTLYMNDGYLMKGGYGPYWWKLGLCYYASGFCFENIFKGKDGLALLFHKHGKQEIAQMEEYVHGSILHGFLDSTPELRKYHVKILNILNKNPRTYHSEEYNNVVEEIVNLYGDKFNKRYYCKLYETYENYQ